MRRALSRTGGMAQDLAVALFALLAAQSALDRAQQRAPR